VSRSWYDRTRVEGVRSVPEGWLSGFADPLFPRGGCTPVVSPVRAASTVPPCSGPVALSSITRCFLFLWFLRGLC